MSSTSFHSIESLPLGDQLLFNRYGRGPMLPLTYRTLTSAFAATASAYPRIIALRECYSDFKQMTYQELDLRSNMVANHLLQRGLQPRGRVVCVYSRCVEMCVFILGVMKAGCQYVPVDGAVMVEESLQHVIEDSGASFVLCLSEFRDKVQRCIPGPDWAASDGTGRRTIVALDAAHHIWKTGDISDPGIEVRPHDGAYVIYTSGTTGKPKGKRVLTRGAIGVDVQHEGTCNTLLNEPGRLGIKCGTNVASILMLGFDMCAWEILGTLINGGTLNMRGSGRGGDKNAWALCLSMADVVIATPSAAQKYFPRRAQFPNIKTVTVGGEPCPQALADEWSHVRFINCCGPTEISILNTAHEHRPGGPPLSIGQPNPNTNVYILDETKQEPVRIGEPGVMWVGGLGVSKGYVNLPELTEQRYRPDKFTRKGRMFNTGDLCQWLPNGELKTLGRVDDQVKIKGVRIELDGVAAAMETFQGVQKACVLKADGAEELWGFYSCDGPRVDERAFQQHLETTLNHYSRPGLIHVAAMPLTAGGKIDKRALRAQATPATQSDASPWKQEGTQAGLLRQKQEKLLPFTPFQPAHLAVGHPIYTHRTAGLASLARLESYEKAFEPISTTDALPRLARLESLEKGFEPVDSYDSEAELNGGKEPPVELPAKRGFHGGRWLRHRVLNAYRKLFLFILAVNAAALVPLVARRRRAPQAGLGIPLNALSTAVAANLLASILIRNEAVVNLIFWAATLPRAAPFWVRRHFARCYHLGGLHSGAAVCATLWWSIFAAQSSLIYFTNRGLANEETPIQDVVNLPMVILTFIILAFLWLVTFHDQFEWTHRFAGWVTLGLVWAHLAVAAEAAHTPLAQNPAVWMVAVITASIALPWTQLRKVKVRAEPLSQHAIRLHFDYCTPPLGKGIRLATKPLSDWHGFATIPVPDQAGFSCVVSRAGDWTSSVIDDPPTQLWKRGVPASGVLRILPLFQRVVLVATGSGIGPCLPVIFSRQLPVRVFWSTPNPEETYGQDIVDAVRATDPDAVIWNTRKQGRPDLAVEAYRLYRESGAEAVCIISNAKVTSKLVYDLEARSVPAFGPVFDS